MDQNGADIGNQPLSPCCCLLTGRPSVGRGLRVTWAPLARPRAFPGRRHSGWWAQCSGISAHPASIHPIPLTSDDPNQLSWEAFSGEPLEDRCDALIQDRRGDESRSSRASWKFSRRGHSSLWIRVSPRMLKMVEAV